MTFFPEKIDFEKLLKPDFWLDGIAGRYTVSTTPISENGFRNFFLALFATFFVVAIALRLYKIFLPKQHPLQSKISFLTVNMIWMSILGICWWLFNQWGPLVFIGSKFWLLIGLVWFLVIFYLAIKYLLTDFRLEIRYYRKTYLQKTTQDLDIKLTEQNKKTKSKTISP
jgi:hypothetical protein